MYALLIVGILLAVALIVVLWRDRKDRLDKEQRTELAHLRVEHEHDRNTIESIQTLVLDHMDVDPFARIVWDELRRKELP